MPNWDAQPVITNQQCWNYVQARMPEAQASTESDFRNNHSWVEVRELQDNNDVYLVGLLADVNFPGANYVAGCFGRTENAGFVNAEA
jgi:hypothetical protein